MPAGSLFFDDGSPGEIFIKISKEGSTLSGLVQGFCRAFSLALQYGLSVEEYRRSNVLGVEVESKDVAALAVAMLGPLFSRTTGAQVPVDGGNERVI